MNTSWAQLVLWRDRFVFSSPHFTGDQSCRPSTVIVIGLDTDLHLATEHSTHRGRAFLIGPNVERSLKAESTSLYSLNLDPSNIYCRALRQKVNASGVLDVSAQVSEQILQLARASLDEHTCCTSIYRDSQKILLALFPDILGASPMDVRAEIVASWLMRHCPARPDLAFLSKLCGLSSSRLAHLFTEEIGISIRQYLLWVKMRIATEMFVNNIPLTTVAQEIGFTDSSHLSKTYSRYFALPPSFLSNKELVKLTICDSVESVSTSRQSRSI